MKVRLNGRELELPDGAGVSAALRAAKIVRADVPLSRQGVAVELNREVIPASLIEQTCLKPGDVLEVVTAFPGG